MDDGEVADEETHDQGPEIASLRPEVDVSSHEPPPPPRHRMTLAMALLVLVGLVALGSGTAMVVAPLDRVEPLERILGVVFGPLVTLLGTSFTWYYSGHRSSGFAIRRRALRDSRRDTRRRMRSRLVGAFNELFG
jgi:hypothetical protein